MICTASQPGVCKVIGTSGAIICRNERKVAEKLAAAFGVTLASLVSRHEQSAFLQDSPRPGRVRAIGELSPDERDKLLYVVDGLLRDAHVRRPGTAA